MTAVRRLVAACVLMAFGAVPVALHGQAKAPKTASEFYLQYRKAFDSATKVDELLPYFASDRRKEIESTPPKERVQMFELIKLMGAVKGLKVLGETPTGDGTTLAVEALDADRNPATGTITIVREDGSFKIASESWRTRIVSRP